MVEGLLEKEQRDKGPADWRLQFAEWNREDGRADRRRTKSRRTERNELVQLGEERFGGQT